MTVKWRKETFWVVWNIDGHRKAVRQTGVTDGRYNYYIAPDGLWHAVMPDCGLGIASAETRAKCRDAAWKVVLSPDFDMTPGQRKTYDEAKRLIYEKTAYWL